MNNNKDNNNNKQEEEEEEETSTMLHKRRTASSLSSSNAAAKQEQDVEAHSLLSHKEEEEEEEEEETAADDDATQSTTTRKLRLPCRHNRASSCCSCSCCCCRYVLGASICLFFLYFLPIYIWVYCLASSHPTGYDRQEQRLGLTTLLLLPLKPFVQRVNQRVTPVSTHTETTVVNVDNNNNNNNKNVTVMPAVWGFDDRDATRDFMSLVQQPFDIYLGSKLSGCSPKFIITAAAAAADDDDGEKKYLFKPSADRHQVWSELLAYQINKIGQFHRVPTVHPFEVKWDVAADAIQQHTQLPFVKCNLGLDYTDQWIKSRPSSNAKDDELIPTWNDDDNNNNNHNDNNNLIGTLQVMVGGIDKQGKIVQRVRFKIGKWTDHTPNVFAQREVNTRTVLDYLIGNYDRYNNEFVQTQPNGDKLSIYIDQGSFIHAPAVDPLLFHLDSYCRFYWRPIHALREQTDLRQAVLDELQSNNFTRSWNQQGLIGVQDHPTIVYLNERLDHVLAVVDECIETFGHDYVFLDVE